MNASPIEASHATGIVFKKLSIVETSPSRSNQHEFNGSKALKGLFGEQPLKGIETDFYLLPETGDPASAKGWITWYDARANHPTRSEYRLYYVGNPVTEKAAAGDILVIGRRADDTAFVAISSGAGAAGRIAKIFNIEVEPGASFAAMEFSSADHGLDETPTDTGGWSAEDESPPLDRAEMDLTPLRELQALIATGKHKPSESVDRFVAENTGSDYLRPDAAIEASSIGFGGSATSEAPNYADSERRYTQSRRSLALEGDSTDRQPPSTDARQNTTRSLLSRLKSLWQEL